MAENLNPEGQTRALQDSSQPTQYRNTQTQQALTQSTSSRHAEIGPRNSQITQMAIDRKALAESIAKHKKKVEEDRIANEKAQLLNDYVRKPLERQKEACAALKVEHEIENGIAKAELQRKLDKVEETLRRQS
jgi:hypothetical protein